MPEALAFSRQQRRQYLLSLVKELDRVIRRDEMALKPRVPFPQEMRELRKLLRLPPDKFLRLDERTFKRNVLMVHSPAHRTHTFWSRHQMWKMATKFGDLRTEIRDAARRGRSFPDLQAKDAPALLRRLDALLDPENEAKATFRDARREVLRTIFGHLQTHFNVGVAFPPFHARFLADRYLPKTGDCIVLDPCAGWGGRLLGTLCVPRTGKVTYCGVDPNENNQDAYEGLTRRVTIWLKKEMPGERAARVFAQPFEKWIKSKTAARLEGRVSFALTSPPYWSAENYDPTADSQSANQYRTYEEWRDGFYRPLMQGVFRLLRPGGVFVLNIADVTGAKLEKDARALATEAGFTFKEFFKLAMSRVPGARQQAPRHAVQVDDVIWKHEPCFVFEKPLSTE